MTAFGLQVAGEASALRMVGFWMIAAGAAYVLFSAARAVLNPGGFASYFGLSLADPADTGFVYVYAARSAFVSLFAVALLIRRDVSALTVFALLTVPLPVMDAVL